MTHSLQQSTAFWTKELSLEKTEEIYLCYTLVMTDKTKAKAIVTLENLRLVESEIFRIASKHGVKNVDQLDSLIAKGGLSEERVGEDLFRLDHLISEKERLEKELKKLSIKKSDTWKSLQDLLELPRRNFQTS